MPKKRKMVVNKSGCSLDKPIGKKHPQNKWTYKVRCAVTYAHYLYVSALTQDEAVAMAEQHCRREYKKMAEQDLNYWEDAATHIYTQFEPEEAE